MTTAITRTTSTLWHTSLWLGEGAITVRPDAVWALLTEPAAEACLDVDAGQVLADPAQVRALFTTALQQILGPDIDAHVTVRVERRSNGHSIGLQYSPATWQGWYTVAGAGAEEGSPSGMLSLHDPRAGCAAVSVPGLPWGRPLTVKPQPGLAVLHPGWLGYSTTPLSVGHRLLVVSATIELSHAHPSQR